MRSTTVTFIISLIWIFNSCTSQPPMKNTSIIISKSEQLEGNFDKEVTIEGYYHLLNVSKRPGTKAYTRRVYIELEDKDAVILETNEKGLRSQEEIDKFIDKKVRATGTLLKNKTIWGNGLEASIVNDCLVNIKSIELLDK